MDPITRSKIHFVDLAKQAEINKSENKDTLEGLGGYTNIRHHVPPDMLPNMYGGDWDYEFRHEEYWREVNSV